MPTNPHHPYPTRCQSQYSLRPHNNHAGLSQPPFQPRRDIYQRIHPPPSQFKSRYRPGPSQQSSRTICEFRTRNNLTPTQTCINPVPSRTPSTISMDYPNNLPAKEGQTPTHPRLPNPVEIPVPSRTHQQSSCALPSPLLSQGGHSQTYPTPCATQSKSRYLSLLNNGPVLSLRPSYLKGDTHKPTPHPAQHSLNPGTSASSTMVLAYPNAPLSSKGRPPTRFKSRYRPEPLKNVLDYPNAPPSQNGTTTNPPLPDQTKYKSRYRSGSSQQSCRSIQTLAQPNWDTHQSTPATTQAAVNPWAGRGIGIVQDNYWKDPGRFCDLHRLRRDRVGYWALFMGREGVVIAHFEIWENK